MSNSDGNNQNPNIIVHLLLLLFICLKTFTVVTEH